MIHACLNKTFKYNPGTRHAATPRPIRHIVHSPLTVVKGTLVEWYNNYEVIIAIANFVRVKGCFG